MLISIILNKKEDFQNNFLKIFSFIKKLDFLNKNFTFKIKKHKILMNMKKI